MGAFRYVTDFEKELAGSYWAALAKTGTSENFPKIGTLSGKKVATAVGFYTVGQSSRSWQLIDQLGTNAAGCDIETGWLVVKMNYRHVSQDTPINIQGLSASAAVVMEASVTVNPGTNHYIFRVRENALEDAYIDQDLGVSADDSFHAFEIRLSKTAVVCKVDSTEFSFSVPSEWQPLYIVKAYVFVNGWSYISYYEAMVTQTDIYQADDPAHVTIDGVGVASAAVKMFESSTSPPQYELTTGLGGLIDYSEVADGTYYVCGMDIFGYAFYFSVEIASGEPV